MSTENIVEMLNNEIDRVTKARDLLVGRNGTQRAYGHKIRRRRPMSAATKAKISAMMKKRWSTRKRAKAA
jgi:hypothetical protein